MRNNRRLASSLSFAMVLLSGAAAHAEEALRYGHSYSLQNGAIVNNIEWGGGYLDKLGNGCGGTSTACISLATTPERDDTSGTWVIMPTGDHKWGDKVMNGDEIALLNISYNEKRFLASSVCGASTCVFAKYSNWMTQDDSHWIVSSADARVFDSPIALGQGIRLKPVVRANYTSYLRRKGTTGCSGSAGCIAVLGDFESTLSDKPYTWRFVDTQTNVPSQLSPGGTYRNHYRPGYILKNDTSSLYWDIAGNLTLSNYAANSQIDDLEGTSVTWGTGWNTVSPSFSGEWAQLNINNDGSMKITGALAGDTGTNTYWEQVAYNYIPPDQTHITLPYSPTWPQQVTLRLDSCKLESRIATTESPYFYTLWSEETAGCNKRTMSLLGRQERCWTAAEPFQFLFDNERQIAINWQNGQLVFVDLVTGNSRELSPKNKPNAKLCVTDTSVSITQPAANGGTETLFDWSGTPEAQNTLSLEPNGLRMRDDTGVPTIIKGTGFGYGQSDHVKRPNGWCTDVDMVFLANANHHASFFSYWGEIVTFTDGDTSPWSSCNPPPYGPGEPVPACRTGKELCFLNDGNLVIYDANHNQAWSTNTSGHPSAVLTLESQHGALQIVNSDRAEICQCIENGGGTECVPATNKTKDAMMLSSSAMEKSSTRLGGAKLRCADPFFPVIWEASEEEQALEKYAFIDKGGFSFLKKDSAGDATFGAQFWAFAGAADRDSIDTLKMRSSASSFAEASLNANLSERASSGLKPDYLGATFSTGVGVTAFKQNVSVGEINAYAQHNNGASGIWGSLKALGSNVEKIESSTALRVYPPIIKAKTVYMVGPIPVEVTAGIFGSVLVDAQFPDMSSNAPRLILKPSVGVGASLTVALGTSSGPLATYIGVEGSVSFLKVSLPGEFGVNWTGPNSFFSYKLRFTASTLDASVSLVGALLGKTVRKELFKRNGVSVSAKLFDFSDLKFSNNL